MSDIKPGESFLARDLVRGGEPVRVEERTASQTLRQWDRIAARIIEVRGRTMLGGTVMPFDAELSDEVLDMLRQWLAGVSDTVQELLASENIDTPREDLHAAGIDIAMRLAAPVFTRVWLDDYVCRLEPDGMPSLVNADGEALVFIELRYPLNKDVTQKQVRAVLDGARELEPASAKVWNWLRPPDATTSRDDNPVGAMTLQSTMPDGSLVLGSLELAGRHLRIDVNSEARAEHADAMLSSLLQGLVGTPVFSHQSIEEVMAAADSSETFEADALSTADERNGLGHVLEDHYRRVLDEPLTALDGMTPREAAQAADSRDKVVAWLKVLENSQAHASPGNAVASYRSRVDVVGARVGEISSLSGFTARLGRFRAMRFAPLGSLTRIRDSLIRRISYPVPLGRELTGK